MTNKNEAFLAALNELIRDHGVTLSPCECCFHQQIDIVSKSGKKHGIWRKDDSNEYEAVFPEEMSCDDPV